MLQKINEAVRFLQDQYRGETHIGIILGTGLGGLVKEIDIKKTVSYADIPHFPVSTVEGHQGRLIFGLLNGIEIIAMQGRFHYYEGYTMQQVTFPVRVMQKMGVDHLLVSNASGGLNPDFKVGDIMVITDHINLFGDNPLLGKNYDELGPRFPDMSAPYNHGLIKKAFETAANLHIKLQKGVYVGTSGPTFETPAEYKYFRIIGGDAVGMSTVPEVIVARHMGVTCFGISIITDSGVPGQIVEISHEEVQKVAATAEPNMTRVITGLVKLIG